MGRWYIRRNCRVCLPWKKLYDRILDYFNLKKKNKYNTSSEFDISTDFELSTKMYTTEWSPPEGTITYYYRWYSRSGRIEFETMGRNLFEKFASYAIKFKPWNFDIECFVSLCYFKIIKILILILLDFKFKHLTYCSPSLFIYFKTF